MSKLNKEDLLKFLDSEEKDNPDLQFKIVCLRETVRAYAGNAIVVDNRCGSCRKKVDEFDSFCRHCGAALYRQAGLESAIKYNQGFH